MKLKKLIADLPIKVLCGSKEVEIMGICSHSKRVAPGDLFLAKKGAQPEHLEEAVASGAVAILSDLPHPFLKKEVVQLFAADVTALVAELAARFYDFPAHKLLTIGVTGTNGKTTTTFLIKHLLDQLGRRCGLIGTIEYIIGAYHFESDLTTPDAITNQKLFYEMVRQGCDSVVMEVSSHGLEQGRVAGIDFDAALFTNLTQDHFDYHGSWENYAAAKAKLFQGLQPQAVAIINEESPWSAKMVEKCVAPTLSYGFTPDADLYAHQVRPFYDHTEFFVTYRNETFLFSWPIIGKHNVANALAAIAFCLSQGYELAQLVPHFLTFPQVPGRLERLDNSLGVHIYIDYAHTPDALESVLKSLQEIARKKIFVVFGAGGDRDRTKRPLMGRAVDQYAHFGVITSDNPRSEDPFMICEQIASGYLSKHYLIEVDRKQAIGCALRMATSDDIILIAGKGHEGYQTFAHQKIPFDDRKVTYEMINEVRCL